MIGGQFAPRLIEMLESPAYRVLSLAAHRVMARVEIELARHGGEDNGRLPVTFADLVEYGVHRHAISPAIRELEALGFVKVSRGKAGNAEFRSPSLFTLTNRPVGRFNATDDWRAIETAEKAERIAREARQVAPKTSVQKQKTSAGFRHVSVMETGTENEISR